MTRRWLIGFSLLAHLGLGIAVVVSGLWRIERLDDTSRAALGIAVMTPPAPPPEGGHASGPLPELTPKKKKRIVHDTQPAPRQPEAAPAPATTTSTSAASDGEGEGDGDGEGKARGPGITGGLPCVLDCDPPTGVCGDRVVDAGEQCDDGNRAGNDGCSATCLLEPPPRAVVSPSVLGALRISGETQIVPPDTVKTTMLRDGRGRTLGTLKVCIDAAGRVASVAVAGSTKYPAYDATLVRAVRAWRYRPHAVDGRPTPACGMVTFVYTIR